VTELNHPHCILELDSQGFPPSLSHVEDMANQLLDQRGAPPVGRNWTSNFIRRHPELKTRFTRKYDYQRALCEDPSLIRGWFTLVQDVMAKYGIDGADIHNFDETGFMMGVISSAMVVTSAERRGKPKMAQPGNREWVTVIQGINSQGWAIPPFMVVAGQNHLANWYQDSDIPKDWVIALINNGWTTNEIGLEWIKHFDKHTKSRAIGRYRLLVLDGHDSHHSAGFELYCKENNIVTLCMPAHSSHLLQPLDVGCFSPLKRAYGGQIEDLMPARVSHITKADFFPAFKTAFHATFTEQNIKAGFRGATFTEQNIKAGFRGVGLSPFDPESVMSELDVRLHTPTPPRSSSGLQYLRRGSQRPRRTRPKQFRRQNLLRIESRVTRKAHQLRFTVAPMQWPANSPDLNPIENIWFLMKKAFHSKWVAARREKSRNLTTQELENLLLDTVAGSP